MVRCEETLLAFVRRCRCSHVVLATSLYFTVSGSIFSCATRPNFFIAEPATILRAETQRLVLCSIVCLPHSFYFLTFTFLHFFFNSSSHAIHFSHLLPLPIFFYQPCLFFVFCFSFLFIFFSFSATCNLVPFSLSMPLLFFQFFCYVLFYFHIVVFFIPFIFFHYNGFLLTRSLSFSCVFNYSF